MKDILLNVDKNGTQYIQSDCPKCGGSGIYSWIIDSGTCFKCNGTGRIISKIYTKEHRAKLDAQNEKRNKVNQIKREEENKARLEKWKEENPEEVKAYNERQKLREEREALKELDRKNSKHIGEPKQRLELELKLEYIHLTDGLYGKTFIHHFRDKDNNILIWFGSTTIDMIEGEMNKVKATIKKHDIYDGIKQTHINRVKLIKS